MNAPESVGAPDHEAGAGESKAMGPGGILRIARERAGYGVDDLAATLKLSRSTLEALESNDFGSLSEPVYVRGYYRKVAKSLGVPEAEVLAAYNELQPSSKTPIRTPETPLRGGVEAAMTRRGGHGLIVAALIVLVSVGSLVYFTSPERASPLLEPEPQVSVVKPAVPAPEPAAPEGELATEPATASEEAAKPLPAPEASAAEVAPEPAPEPQPQAQPTASEGVLPAVARNADPNKLVLIFPEPSFVRIEDAEGKTLLIGLVRADQTRILDGTPPYAVFLGNAGKVQVYHDGKAIQFAETINPNNQTSRFTVPR